MAFNATQPTTPDVLTANDTYQPAPFNYNGLPPRTLGGNTSNITPNGMRTNGLSNAQTAAANPLTAAQGWGGAAPGLPWTNASSGGAPSTASPLTTGPNNAGIASGAAASSGSAGGAGMNTGGGSAGGAGMPGSISGSTPATAPTAGTPSTPPALNGFTKTGPNGQAAPTGMGDLVWDTKNNKWVGGAAAKDESWWRGQSQGWQDINAMPQGQDRQQAAIAYAAAHPDEPMAGAIGGYGWGPTQTMEMAGQYGYTWLPGIGQAPVTMSPGLSDPVSGAAPYDPQAHPAGSVSVPDSLTQAPAGSSYSRDQWLASHGGPQGGVQTGTAMGNPISYAGQPSGYVNSQPQQQQNGFMGNGSSGGAGQQGGSQNNGMDPGLLALLGGLFGSQQGGGYHVQQTPYGYTQWAPNGNQGMGTNQYGILGGGMGMGGPGTGVYTNQQSQGGFGQQQQMQALMQMLGGQSSGNITQGSSGGAGSDPNSQFMAILRLLSGQ